jgi:molybdopterin converting factor small subunit
LAALVILPGILAAEAGNQARFELDVATVAQALHALPVADLLFDERGELRRLVNVYVDGVDVRERGGLDAPLAGGETIRLVPAIAGGEQPAR